MKKRGEWGLDGIPVDLGLIGRKAAVFFRNVDANIMVHIDEVGDSVHPDQLAGVVGGLIEAYKHQEIDRLYIAYINFRSVIRQEPRIIQLLPVSADALARDEILSDRPYTWDNLYEPTPDDIRGMLLLRYLEALVFQSVVENQACEQAARMVAMKNASDNAGDLIRELQLSYNKARQAAITAEIAEIVAGSAAV